MSRKVSYFVACSLDGFIAGKKGEIDWLFTDQDYGYAAFYQGVDVLLMGRKTYQTALSFQPYPHAGKKAYVFTRTLKSSPLPDVELTREDPVALVSRLRAQPGGIIWLVGGFGLVSQLWYGDQIDELVVSIHPLTLGQGISLLPTDLQDRKQWELKGSQGFGTGLLQAVYERVRG